MSDYLQERIYLPDGTLSRVSVGSLQLFAIERSKDDLGHPCIPEARYRLEKHHGPKAANGLIFAMVNEDEGVFHSETMTTAQIAVAKAKGLRIRTDCLFGHVGNDQKDVEGCSAFGREVPDWNKAWVSESHEAVIDFQMEAARTWDETVGIVIRSMGNVPKEKET